MKKLLIALSVATLGLAHAEVTVKDPWVRATVAQQKTTAAYMVLSSNTDAHLVGVKSMVAGMTEVHSMKMNNGVMEMRAAPSLDLPAGKTVALSPGGYHVMLMDLKQQMHEGDSVTLTLEIENKDGKHESVVVQAPVKAMAATGAMGDMGGMKH